MCCELGQLALRLFTWKVRRWAWQSLRSLSFLPLPGPAQWLVTHLYCDT
jgi:hypothetical protein